MQKTGFLNAYKLSGYTSASCVSKIKRLAKRCLGDTAKCGHMGTLDPLASGVLPIAVGNATRLFDYFLDKRKKYIATFQFGFSTDTLDIEGTTTNMTEILPTKEEIEKVLPSFLGKIQQVPPMYSAKSINGQRCYDLARKGIEIELQPKEIEIFSIDLKEQIEKNKFVFEIECGGGTYIRSIARDIAFKTNSLATMTALERTQSGIFKKENSILLEDLNESNFFDMIIPTEQLVNFDKIFAEGDFARKLFNGVPSFIDKPNGLYMLYNVNEFYGIAEVNNGEIKVRTKLC